MNNELVAMGYGDDVQFAIINGEFAKSSVTNLTDQCDFPVFQDTSKKDAWGQHDGFKDDMYIYDKEGKLVQFFPYGGDVSTNLSVPSDYEGFKNHVLDALKAN